MPLLQLTGGAAHVIFVPGANAKQSKKEMKISAGVTWAALLTDQHHCHTG